MYNTLNSDPSDPDVIIKLDISNTFNVLCSCLTLDVLGGKASCDYACGLQEGDNIEILFLKASCDYACGLQEVDNIEILFL
jgi:hypothetical protein